ncbi:MAG: Crp/Fnr family transcriptional regulator [Bacteroidia bacterium]
MTECSKCKIFNQCFASLLTIPELNELQNNLSTQKLEKNEYLFYEGAGSKKLYMIISGTIILKLPGINSQPHILGIARPGNMIGTASILPESKNVITTKALSNVTLCTVNKTIIEKFMDSNKDLRNHILNIMYKRQLSILNYTQVMLSGNTQAKLAYSMLVFSEKEGEIIADKATLANMAGLRRETVSRLLKKFKDNKIIESNQRKIKILNKEKLRNLVTDY